jgi:hypothetical protein
VGDAGDDEIREQGSNDLGVDDDDGDDDKVVLPLCGGG